MHGCPTKQCGKTKWAQLALGDTWSKTWLPGLLNSPEYQSGSTIIFVIWDQGGATASNTAFFVVSPYTTPGSTSTTPFTHYSLLRGTEDLLGLPPLQHAGDATTNSVANDFGLPLPAGAPASASSRLAPSRRGH
jgi:phosphatidylinositol-3-phosphatase